MNGDHETVDFGVNSGSGIKVTNSHKYPVKIIMWIEDEGTNIVIYVKMIELVPLSADLNDINITDTFDIINSTNTPNTSNN